MSTYLHDRFWLFALFLVLYLFHLGFLHDFIHIVVSAVYLLLSLQELDQCGPRLASCIHEVVNLVFDLFLGF